MRPLPSAALLLALFCLPACDSEKSGTPTDGSDQTLGEQNQTSDPESSDPGRSTAALEEVAGTWTLLRDATIERYMDNEVKLSGAFELTEDMRTQAMATFAGSLPTLSLSIGPDGATTAIVQAPDSEPSGVTGTASRSDGGKLDIRMMFPDRNLTSLLTGTHSEGRLELNAMNIPGVANGTTLIFSHD